ncbi:MAG: hypothetical protein H7836_10685 [Magnetococcus sp. YQC-3]
MMLNNLSQRILWHQKPGEKIFTPGHFFLNPADSTSVTGISIPSLIPLKKILQPIEFVGLYF